MIACIMVQIQHVDARWLIVQKHKVLNVKPPFSFILISIPIAYLCDIGYKK